ncbi:MAG: class I SAM-dependent methyltransferase [Patescibacteria group bacterium]
MDQKKAGINFKKGKLVSGVIYPSFFPITKEDLVLNIGCGDGVQAVVYGGNFKEMVGVDINEKSLATAVAVMDYYGIKNFKSIGGNVEKIPLNDRFDKAIAIDIIEHVIHPEKVIGEIRRLLKDNGRLLMTFPAMHDKWERFFRLVGQKILRRRSQAASKNGWNPDRHQHDYSLKKWLKLLQHGGFKLVKSRASTMWPPLHYLGLPKFWFSSKIIRTIDGFFCRLPIVKNFGQALVCEFIKDNKHE